MQTTLKKPPGGTQVQGTTSHRKWSNIQVQSWIIENEEEYVEEFARTSGEGLKEHFRAPTHIYDYANTTGHFTKCDNFTIVGRESDTFIRTIRDAISIRVKDPSLKRDWQEPAALQMG